MTGNTSCDVVTEAGSYLRLIDLCFDQLKARGPSRTCNKSAEEEAEAVEGKYLWSGWERSVSAVTWFQGGLVFKAHRLLCHSTLGSRVSKKKGERR